MTRGREVTLRPGAPGDADAVAGVWLASRYASVPGVPPPVHSAAEVRSWFASVVLPSEREVWVAEDGENVVALLVLHGDWIEHLYVLPGRTGAGVGSQLIELAKSRRDELQLWTFESNTGARRFYEHRGFVAVERTEGDNEEGAPDVRYRWPPGAPGRAALASPGVRADALAAKSAEAWERLIEALPGGWVRRKGGALGAVTGVELASYNGVWGVSASPDPSAVAELLDEVAAAGVPFCMQLRPGWPDELASAAAARQLVRVPGEPVMVLDGPGTLVGPRVPSELEIRQLDAGEGAVHAAVAAAGFGEPEAAYRQVMTTAVLSRPGLRCYVGEVGGRPVTTAIGATAGPCVAVFAVATLAPHRGRGYGAAVTGRVVRDGFADGATWAWLSSSPAGLSVYRRLGFEVVEHWDFWEST
jgi:GNAT superfamily N-acetyltransferase